MPRYAIGDVQGCLEPLEALLKELRFSADRDQLYFVGDLVNRGPDSLGVLRLVRSLGAAARTVLGNHDLHLLALHHDSGREQRKGDTLDEVLEAKDREALLGWLLHQPLAIDDAEHGDLIVHGGVVPNWTRTELTTQARSTERALQVQPRKFFSNMYGNKPDRWEDAHTDAEKHRFTINVLTRMRYCHADGRIDLKLKGAPGTERGPWQPWFEHPRRLSDRRIVFGHWSTLGLLRRPDLLALDTGCVWGGALTAVNLDDPAADPVEQRCRGCQASGGE